MLTDWFRLTKPFLKPITQNKIYSYKKQSCCLFTVIPNLRSSFLTHPFVIEFHLLWTKSISKSLYSIFLYLLYMILSIYCSKQLQWFVSVGKHEFTKVFNFRMTISKTSFIVSVWKQKRDSWSWSLICKSNVSCRVNAVTSSSGNVRGTHPKCDAARWSKLLHC